VNALGTVVCDEGAIHPNPGGPQPDTGLATKLTLVQTITCPGKPAVATETGYHTALNTSFGQSPVSDIGVGKYIPRLYFDYFNAGLKRTFVYEFLDEHPDPGLGDQEQHFGMIKSDNTPKPSFTAVKNLISLLKEPGKTVEPEALEYVLSGNTTNLRHTLLQKSDGRYYLVLWANATVYDAAAKTDILNPTQPLYITFNCKFSSIQVFQPRTDVDAVQTGRGDHIQLYVPDEILILQLTPK
jgi:hypothetical protein